MKKAKIINSYNHHEIIKHANIEMTTCPIVTKQLWIRRNIKTNTIDLSYQVWNSLQRMKSETKRLNGSLKLQEESTKVKHGSS